MNKFIEMLTLNILEAVRANAKQAADSSEENIQKQPAQSAGSTTCLRRLTVSTRSINAGDEGADARDEACVAKSIQL